MTNKMVNIGKLTADLIDKPHYKVIDNFLPIDVFNEIHDFLLPQPETFGELTTWKFPTFREGQKQLRWGYMPGVETKEIAMKKEDWRLFYLVHMVYDNTIKSPFYEIIIPHCESTELDIKALLRIKINMFPNTETFKEHALHVDYDFPHKGSIFSIYIPIILD